ncbi:hypothetical protein A1Q2_08105 [Trichosporon asahii var. asahii CBS 8904]|uniref:Uracil transporter FurD n=1 Tax=Trichosporon asahii var. asahii (strain CBS 8904) TaxID=1220162 RepID=K1VLF7_TRIAC|nr:hypothetical protein A1Q2_08105 [Trichosporon asahii var. asahii CBS 8904]
MFWLAINSWSGGQFVQLMIIAIWPSYARLPNAVPASQGATTSDFLSFFIFWVIQLPFIFIHPSKLKLVFNIKAAVVPVVAIGTLIWAVKIAGPQAGPILRASRNRAPAGKLRFIAFCTSATAVQGTWATLSLNIGDFSRYCRSPRSNWIQIFAFPLINTTVSLCAAISATCAYAVYNEDLYQPYDILAKWNTSPGGRAAMFLGSLAWALSNVTNNITANSISAANDLCSLAPKHVNIKRGQLVAVTVGVWAFVPWKILASAENFLAFMSSYSIVLAPIAMLMVIDFYVVKKKKFNIYEMYKPFGIYRYTKGWNWRAYVALACAVAPNMPGMVHAIDPTTEIGNIKYVYMVSNLVAYAIVIPVYLLLNKIWPAPEAIVDEPVHDIIDDKDEFDSHSDISPAQSGFLDEKAV